MILEPNMLIDELSVLRILDQTLLPNEEVFLDLSTTEEIWEAIREKRGAAALELPKELDFRMQYNTTKKE